MFVKCNVEVRPNFRNKYLFQDQNAGKMFADEAAVLFERSITTAMKGNILLYFSYADFEEVCVFTLIWPSGILDLKTLWFCV